MLLFSQKANSPPHGAASKPNRESIKTRQGQCKGVIRRLVGIQEENFVKRSIGNAQAWVFVDDGVALLWECYLFKNFRTHSREVAFWEAFENLLKEKTETKEIYTPSGD